jgi:hypothetical protein
LFSSYKKFRSLKIPQVSIDFRPFRTDEGPKNYGNYFISFQIKVLLQIV